MYDFETIHDRTRWSATKWAKYAGTDVIPLWIADMDFATAPQIQKAITTHVVEGDLGYMTAPSRLNDLLIDHHWQQYRWAVEKEWIVWLPGVVLGLNLAVKACCAIDESVIAFSPIYPPFLKAPALQNRQLVNIPLLDSSVDGDPWQIDFSALEKIAENSQTHEDGTHPVRLLLLCHPHNPIGRLFTKLELSQLASLCEKYNLYVCSDELHCDLILKENTQHVPFALVAAEHAPELLQRLITLHGPGKTYNMPGLGIAWAIIQSPVLRERFRAAMQKLVPDPCCLGYTALEAAFEHGESWRQELIVQLRMRRDMVSRALEGMGLAYTHPEVSYLTWIDARTLMKKIGNPAKWFEKYGVGLSDGADFGSPGYLRLNFALPTALLTEALRRMALAVAGA